MVQNSLTAANSIRSVTQGAQQVMNHIEQVRQGAQNLVQSPLRLADQLYGLYEQYDGYMRQLEGIPYKIDATRARYEQVYRAFEGGDPRQMSAQVRGMLGQLRTANKAAMESQAIEERLRANRQKLYLAIQASEGAQGALAAQQAQTQLSGVLAAQQRDLTELMATSNRAHTSYLAVQGSMAELAEQRGQDMMAGWGQCPDCNNALSAFPKMR